MRVMKYMEITFSTSPQGVCPAEQITRMDLTWKLFQMF